jgi:DNA invertase Pin-like site-specific DNA recombinase
MSTGLANPSIQAMPLVIFFRYVVLFAEFENNLRLERQLAGIQRSKTEGKYKGRKATAKAKAPQVVELSKDPDLTRNQIAEQLEIGVASVYRILREIRNVEK